MPDCKRLFDFIISAAVLLIAFVPMVGLCFLIAINLGAPVFFVQERPGLNGKPFRMYKFRTMTSSRDSLGRLLPDSERLTKFGIWLRASSLDELPELLNVLMGDMSLVGPRPLLMEYLPLYSRAQNRRHEVRPGITGWAQVNGRNALSWGEKFELDLWYVDNYSIFLDLKILVMTVKKVLFRHGINAAGEATMPKFTGKE